MKTSPQPSPLQSGGQAWQGEGNDKDISTYPQAKTEKLERKIKNVLIIF